MDESLLGINFGTVLDRLKRDNNAWDLESNSALCALAAIEIDDYLSTKDYFKINGKFEAVKRLGDLIKKKMCPRSPINKGDIIVRHIDPYFSVLFNKAFKECYKIELKTIDEVVREACKFKWKLRYIHEYPKLVGREEMEEIMDFCGVLRPYLNS